MATSNTYRCGYSLQLMPHSIGIKKTANCNMVINRALERFNKDVSNARITSIKVVPRTDIEGDVEIVYELTDDPEEYKNKYNDAIDTVYRLVDQFMYNTESNGTPCIFTRCESAGEHAFNTLGFPDDIISIEEFYRRWDLFLAGAQTIAKPPMSRLQAYYEQLKMERYRSKVDLNITVDDDDLEMIKRFINIQCKSTASRVADFIYHCVDRTLMYEPVTLEYVISLNKPSTELDPLNKTTDYTTYHIGQDDIITVIIDIPENKGKEFVATIPSILTIDPDKKSYKGSEIDKINLEEIGDAIFINVDRYSSHSEFLFIKPVLTTRAMINCAQDKYGLEVAQQIEFGPVIKNRDEGAYRMAFSLIKPGNRDKVYQALRTQYSDYLIQIEPESDSLLYIDIPSSVDQRKMAVEISTFVSKLVN